MDRHDSQLSRILYVCGNRSNHPLTQSAAGIPSSTSPMQSSAKNVDTVFSSTSEDPTEPSPSNTTQFDFHFSTRHLFFILTNCRLNAQ